MSSVLTIQSDHTLLLDSEHPDAEAARFSVAPFAELIKTPGPLHHYRLTSFSLWNAAAAGAAVQEIIATLENFSAQTIPLSARVLIETHVASYGRVWIEDAKAGLALCSTDAALLNQLASHPGIQSFLTCQRDERSWLFDPQHRGQLKQALVHLQQPADDRAAYQRGALLALTLRDGQVALRDYQRAAIERMIQGGSGVVVLPCGAGKTMVGIGLIAAHKTNTLILAPGIIAARQWAQELVEKTTLSADEIGEYSGERKQVRPITIATYQMLTQAAEIPHALSDLPSSGGSPDSQEKANSSPAQRGRLGGGTRPHLSLFSANDWGLIIYDEVHLLPAPVFRLAAAIQATRRLGLTATLVREDHREGDVFALVGPTRYQAGWKELERAGWIAEAICTEVRIEMEEEERLTYVKARRSEQARIAGENVGKLIAAQKLAAQHRHDQVLIIGQYLEQLKRIADSLHAPLISGRMPNDERARLYAQFRRGEIKLLVVSKVANYAVDLPDANVAIQVSGTFGSRQEEAQRLGRLLRPKANGAQAHFYALVTQDTVEQVHAARRQRFLIEQGYAYKIVSM